MIYDWLLVELRLNIGAAEIVAAATGNEGVLNNIRLHKESVEAIEDLQNKLNLWRHDKISRWIPVTERLPEQKGFYLVFAHGVIGTAYYGSKWWTEDPRIYEPQITHWMPMLPEPPEPVSNPYKLEETE